MKILLAILFLLVLIEISCKKSIPITGELPISSLNDSNILVDASKDDGVWWSPQSGTGDHQGHHLARYLRTLGFHVDELSPGTIITDSLLKKYSKIIRSAAFSQYSDDELAAYKNFLNKPCALLLLQDHLYYSNAVNDNLSEMLGLHFVGAVEGTVTNFVTNEITNGVTELSYIAGSVVTNSENNPSITVLGTLDKNDYTVINNSFPFIGGTNNIDAPIMGILNNYPNTKIFFLGDENGIEYAPQPFTQNLVNWLF